MKLTRFTGIAAAGLTVLAVSLITGATPASAENGQNGQLHIVKDCGTFSGTPGSSYCQIVSSNLPELPAGTKIYYDQITAGPTAGVAGFLDSNVFVYISESQWAVGRCTVPNDNHPGLCILSDGVGSLAGFTARINVTYKPGGDGFLYAWNGTYSFKSLSHDQ
ncbi:MAG TPA: hypothetical protein VKX49_18315 [Bryobacteraceae bacterium]|nr:hypothetical protein [Bryobacteraceae bacterium]